MKITRVTITGADNKIFHYDLVKLQIQYPFVEWGILYSSSKAGESRYPTLEHIKAQFNEQLELSAHFCGWYSTQVLEKQNFKLITDLPDIFKRVQLNYNFRNSTGWSLIPVIEFAKANPKMCIILQYNKSNSEILDRLLTLNPPSNIHYLYDSSGGRGTVMGKIQEPFKNRFTGYSGGISSDNIDSICTTINITKNNDSVWIDMESGVRTNDNFSLHKVEKILQKCSRYVNTKF